MMDLQYLQAKEYKLRSDAAVYEERMCKRRGIVAGLHRPRRRFLHDIL